MTLEPPEFEVEDVVEVADVEADVVEVADVDVVWDLEVEAELDEAVLELVLAGVPEIGAFTE